MKVYSIYFNATEGLIVACGNSKEDALKVIVEDEDSPLFDKDLSEQRVDIYEEKNLQTTHTEPTVITYMFNDNLDF
jgi:hypothetical protein